MTGPAKDIGSVSDRTDPVYEWRRVSTVFASHEYAIPKRKLERHPTYREIGNTICMLFRRRVPS